MLEVALLAEGVDRNGLDEVVKAPPEVALLAEGVDRNFLAKAGLSKMKLSPSSRRAWIEISSWSSQAF